MVTCMCVGVELESSLWSDKYSPLTAVSNCGIRFILNT